MIPIDYFVRMASHCAAKCKQAIPEADQRQTAVQWQQHLGDLDQGDLGRAFGIWQHRTGQAPAWQLPGASEIRDILGVGGSRRKRTQAVFTEPRRDYLESVRKIRRLISEQYPSSTVNAPAHRFHRFDPITNTNDVSDCPICGDAPPEDTTSTGARARDRREYVSMLLAQLPTPAEPTFPCRCGILEGWVDVGDGVVPCPSCHPMGVNA